LYYLSNDLKSQHFTTQESSVDSATFRPLLWSDQTHPLTYVYDQAGQLLKTQSDSGTSTRQYDKGGNPYQGATADVHAGNQLQTYGPYSYAYDAEGNVRLQEYRNALRKVHYAYSYDLDNHLVQATVWEKVLDGAW